MLIRMLVVLIWFGFATGTAGAATFTFSGYFNDSANSALVSSDLSSAGFADDYAIATNVALYSLSVPIAGTVTFDSNGFAAGGADPYFSLFSGSGTSATFLGSNYDQAFSTGGDFLLSFALVPGDYKIAMSVFANMSFAENYGYGALGDGFTGLGGPYCLGSSFYELVVTTPDQQAVPEPATLLLMGSGLFGLAWIRRRR